MSTIAQTVQLSLATAAYDNGGVLSSPVTQSANTNLGLVDEAAQLSELGSTVVSLSGGNQTAAATTYNAAGLLNSFSQAGSLQGSLLSASSAASAASTAQQSTEQGIVSQMLGGSSASTTLSSQWTQLLQANPELAGQAAQNITNGSILNTLA